MKRAMSAFAAAAALGVGLMATTPAISQDIAPNINQDTDQLIVVPDAANEVGDNAPAPSPELPPVTDPIQPQDNVIPPKDPALDALPQVDDATPGTPDANASSEPDLFHPGFYDTFEVSACTSDNFTVTASIAAYASMSDWERLNKVDPSVQMRFGMATPSILHQAWSDVVSKYTKDYVLANGDGFKKVVTDRMHDAENDIENATGVSVLVMGGTKAQFTPGCN